MDPVWAGLVDTRSRCLSLAESLADQAVTPTPVRPKLKSFQISTLVLSFSTIARFEYPPEDPSP
jgi:hypothetical protein